MTGITPTRSLNGPGTVNPSLRLWALFFALSCSLSAADWPRWRGPNLDGICTETGLLKEWPKAGPPLLWQVTGLGTGYSSVSIVDGKLYTMGDLPGEGGEKQQLVICLDLNTKKILWTAKVGPPHSDGSRCTPTVDDGHVYAIGTSGGLVCLNAQNGELVWQKNFAEDFNGKMMSGWKYSESVLIDGDKLICTPGANSAILAALNKKTGELLWQCSMPNIGNRGKDGAGYSSIVISQGGGLRQYVQITGRGCIGVSAADGKFLWGYNRVANGTANIPTPVVEGDYVFCSTAYGTGAALLKLSLTGDGNVEAQEVYFLDENVFQNHHGGFVLLDGYIYGGHGHNKGDPTCLELKTGKIVWKEKQPGGGSAAVLYADGNLIFRYQQGEVCLIKATPEGYQLKGQFTPPKESGMSGPAWAHPVIADKKLYLRHKNVLQCFDLAP